MTTKMELHQEIVFTRLLVQELLLGLVYKGVLSKAEAIALHETVRAQLKERGLLV